MSEASRLPLYLMIGLSVLVHGLFLTGLPNLPWFTGPPDIFKLTRYVVRFAKPAPTAVPTLTQVAIAEPVRVEPAPVEPVVDRQIPKPVQRVETRPERVVERRVAPVPVKPVVPEPLEQKKPRTVSRREQVVNRTPRTETARQAVRRVTAAVPQTAAPVVRRAMAVSQPRQATSQAALQALVQQEQLLAAQEQSAFDAYKGIVFQRLEKHRRYPRIAERGGLQGRVVIRFTVRWDGEIIESEILDLVGHKSFGDASIQALKRVGQLPPFPSEIRKRQITMDVPIVYQLDDN